MNGDSDSEHEQAHSARDMKDEAQEVVEEDANHDKKSDDDSDDNSAEESSESDEESESDESDKEPPCKKSPTKKVAQPTTEKTNTPEVSNEEEDEGGDPEGEDHEETVDAAPIVDTTSSKTHTAEDGPTKINYKIPAEQTHAVSQEELTDIQTNQFHLLLNKKHVSVKEEHIVVQASTPWALPADCTLDELYEKMNDKTTNVQWFQESGMKRTNICVVTSVAVCKNRKKKNVDEDNLLRNVGFLRVKHTTDAGVEIDKLLVPLNTDLIKMVWQTAYEKVNNGATPQRIKAAWDEIIVEMFTKPYNNNHRTNLHNMLTSEKDTDVLVMNTRPLEYKKTMVLTGWHEYNVSKKRASTAKKSQAKPTHFATTTEDSITLMEIDDNASEAPSIQPAPMIKITKTTTTKKPKKPKETKANTVCTSSELAKSPTVPTAVVIPDSAPPQECIGTSTSSSTGKKRSLEECDSNASFQVVMNVGSRKFQFCVSMKPLD